MQFSLYNLQNIPSSSFIEPDLSEAILGRFNLREANLSNANLKTIKDQEFANRLNSDLMSNGVRCWYAPKDMKIGDKIRPAIYKSIREYDKVLLVLSEDSISSEWVEDEVETAFEQERIKGDPVLFPVRIDDAVMVTDQAWLLNSDKLGSSEILPGGRITINIRKPLMDCLEI